MQNITSGRTKPRRAEAPVDHDAFDAPSPAMYYHAQAQKASDMAPMIQQPVAVYPEQEPFVGEALTGQGW